MGLIFLIKIYIESFKSYGNYIYFHNTLHAGQEGGVKDLDGEQEHEILRPIFKVDQILCIHCMCVKLLSNVYRVFCSIFHILIFCCEEIGRFLKFEDIYNCMYLEYVYE